MFINKRFYIVVIVIIACFLVGFKSVFMFTLAQFFLLALVVLTVYDYILLYRKKAEIKGARECAERFSNGDKNKVKLHIVSTYSIPVSLKIIDEVPVIFQMRDLLFKMEMGKEDYKILTYSLVPVKRGVYRFGSINIFVSTKIGLLSRRFIRRVPCNIKVYPSYIHLNHYEFIAISNKLTDPGMKKIKRIGQQLEPDQIRDYIRDDDYRTINWKATARKNKLMVNVFQEDRAQNVYCLIDKGRTMQAAFEKMTLLDYSINASLALSYVAMLKGDKAGLVTFEKTTDTVIPASRYGSQLQKIMEALYSQTNTFAESDFSSLYQSVNRNIKGRSLFLIFTNFDTIPAMQRQLKFLSMLAKKHTVIVVFFENTGIRELTEITPSDKQEVYEQVIAEKIAYDKSLIVNKLRQGNMISILTHPENLTVNVINKYLEIKARGFY